MPPIWAAFVHHSNRTLSFCVSYGVWRLYARFGAVTTLVLTVSSVCAQSLADLRTPVPVSKGDTLIIGFLGGWEPWDNENRGVRKLALKLRGRSIPGLYVETLSNHKRSVALEFVRSALDSNGNGLLEAPETTANPIIIYGQSFGGAAVVKFARQLQALGVPIVLTVQVDSVGRGDDLIPANVAAAANLYQGHRFTIRGEDRIRAADSSRTRIIENTRYQYDKRNPDNAPDTWFRRRFGGGHAWMDADPVVWNRVEELIMNALAPQRTLSSGVK